MDHLAPVRIAHRIQHLQEHADARRPVEPARVAPRHQGFALHVLHRDVRNAAGIHAGVVQAGDPRILQRGEDVAFEREALGHLRRTTLQARDLQRHLAFERAVGAAGEPDVRHAAGPQRPQQLVGAELLARLAAGRSFRPGVGCLDARRTIQRPAAPWPDRRASASRSVRTSGWSSLGQRVEPGPPRSGGNGRASSSNSPRRAICRFVRPCGPALFHRRLQHQPGLQPQPLHGAFGDVQRLGDFLFAVAAEVAHLHHLGEARDRPAPATRALRARAGWRPRPPAAVPPRPSTGSGVAVRHRAFPRRVRGRWKRSPIASPGTHRRRTRAGLPRAARLPARSGGRTRAPGCACPEGCCARRRAAAPGPASPGRIGRRKQCLARARVACLDLLQQLGDLRHQRLWGARQTLANPNRAMPGAA